MNINEKANEAKVYGETKTELIKLIGSYLQEYTQYSELYKELFKKWRDNIVNEFKLVFIKENFDIKESKKSYSHPYNSSMSMTVSFYDLEFELTLDEESFDIRFKQNKPSTEAKSIIIRPTIKHYSIQEVEIASDVTYRRKKASSISELQEILKNVENATYSIKHIQEFHKKLTVEMNNLLACVKLLNETRMKSLAVSSDIYNTNKDNKYGEFEHFIEFIEMI